MDRCLVILCYKFMEKAKATRSSILAWRTPWTEESGGLPGGHKELDMTEPLNNQKLNLLI